ncbi:hypothetical protein C8R45DRAFT_496720 [Mycena sanguinolenta]|nr:hypothetical protein C8R45DRAFT_496720 [Mycena sanguinolenta]
MVSAVVDFKKEPPSSTASTATSSSTSTSSNSPPVSTSSPTASATTFTATHPHLSLLTIDAPLNSSPFPSPSSSFLPPPIPGAHEFAMMPAPAGRKGVASPVVNGTGGTGTGTSMAGGVNGAKDHAADSPSVTTPRAFSGMLPTANEHSSSSSAPAPTVSNADHTTTTPAGKNGVLPSTSGLSATSPLTPTPSAITPTPKRVSFPPPSSSPATSSADPTPCTTPITSAFLIAAASASGGETPHPSSSRPAPPSPVLSRRTSMARSESRRNSAQMQMRAEGDSRRGSPRSSRALSSGVGTVAGVGAGAAAASPSARHRLSRSISAAEVEGEAMFVDAVAESPQTASTSASAEPTTGKGPQKSPITIRDFAYQPTDVRYAGLGPDVPTPCDPARLARRLRGAARLSDYASPGSPDRDDDDEDGWGSGGFMWGRGRMTFGGTSPSLPREDGVGAADFARNFADPEDEEDDGDEGYAEGEEEEGEEDLYYAEAYAEVPPGLYRAQFAFEAIDAAEMHLREGQLIHIVGSGATAPDEPEPDGAPGTGARQLYCADTRGGRARGGRPCTAGTVSRVGGARAGEAGGGGCGCARGRVAQLQRGGRVRRCAGGR